MDTGEGGVEGMDSIYIKSAEMRTLPMAVIQRFRLTHDESELCLELLHGKTLDDIADEYHQSRSSVRGTYEGILAKTGADTEAKLITIVLSSAVEES